MSGPLIVEFKSPNVCWSCRVRKQRCDKTFPSCSRCVSKLFHCNYSWDTQPKSSPYPSIEPAGLLVASKCSECFDLSSTGASEMLRAGADADPARLANLSTEILQGAQLTIADLLDEYSGTISKHLPILSIDQLKASFRSRNELHDSGLSVLALAVYLVTQLPCKECRRSMRSTAYSAIKQTFMLQVSRDPTLEVLQAGLLITYYECGHGFSREAHITLMNCIAIARLIGLEFGEMAPDDDHNRERSACHWAVVLLDRTIALSCLSGKVPLGLPANMALDMERVTPILVPAAESSSFFVSSRVALAIGAAVEQANSPSRDSLLYRSTNDSMESLIRTLVLAAETSHDSYIYCPATCIAMSALFAMHDSRSSHDSTDPSTREKMYLQSLIRMIRDTCEEATQVMLKAGEGDAERGLSSLSIIIVCALARAAVILARLGIGGSDFTQDEIDMLRFNLRSFSSRWTIAESYLADFDKMLRLSTQS